MKFNGKDISSYWSAKAVKFDTSYFTDYDQQEISIRGQVAATLAVPTVRKIDVDIRLKDRDKYLLEKSIRDMCDWLKSSGESKLICERNPNWYYKARCTGVSVPVFAGVSATFTITFICSDYRPYSVIDNQPIGDADELMTNFTFNNKHCLRHMNCLFVMNSHTILPKVKRKAYEISGVSGTMYYKPKTPVYEERVASGTLYFLKSGGSTELMSPTEISEREHEVAKWLLQAGRAKLVFDSNPTRAIDAEFVDATELTMDKWANGSINLKMTLQPFWYDIEATVTERTVNIPSTYGYFYYTGASGMSVETPPVITVKNVGENDIQKLEIYFTRGTSRDLFRLQDNSFRIGVGQTLTIDCVNCTVTRNGTDLLKCVKSGDFPVIYPDSSSFTVYTDVATTLEMKVSFNRRWL